MDQVWINLLNSVVLLLLQLIGLISLVLLHRSLPALKRWLDNHTTLTQQQLLKELGRAAFRYAEAVFASASGQEKLNQALAYASAVAKRQGLTLTEPELRAAIEHAVYDANQVMKQTTIAKTGADVKPSA